MLQEKNLLEGNANVIKDNRSVYKNQRNSDQIPDTLAKQKREKTNTEFADLVGLVSLVQDETVENRPNLLSKNPHLGDVISISEIELPEHRYDNFICI